MKNINLQIETEEEKDVPESKIVIQKNQMIEINIQMKWKNLQEVKEKMIQK